MATVLEVKARIIRKMVRWRKWGGSHTENILSGLPRHLRGDRIVREALDQMVQDKWLLPVKKTREVHYSLNPEKADEILRFYDEYTQNKG